MDCPPTSSAGLSGKRCAAARNPSAIRAVDGSVASTSMGREPLFVSAVADKLQPTIGSTGHGYQFRVASLDLALRLGLRAKTRFKSPRCAKMTEVKRVLIIAYHFPPIGGAGVQRTVKFARYLHEFGYEPIVVTGAGEPADPTLGGDATRRRGSTAPVSLAVQSASTDPEPLPAGSRRARLERWLRRQLDSDWRRWWVNGVLEAARAAGPVDVLLGDDVAVRVGDRSSPCVRSARCSLGRGFAGPMGTR